MDLPYTPRSQSSAVEWLAWCLYRWRIVLSAAIVLGAAVLAPRVNITHVDNDLDAWFSRADPLYRDYERFRREFGGSQPLIIAIRADPGRNGETGAGIFTRERLAVLKDISDDIERIPTVARVQSLATANVLRAHTSPTDQRTLDEGTVEIKRLLDVSRSPDDIRRLALDDGMIRGQLIAADGTVAAVVVTFDEDRFNESRAETLSRIYSAVRSRLTPGLTAYYNGSIEIDETYNRVTVQNQRRFVPPILALTLLAVYALFRSVRRALVVLLSIAVSVVWTLGLYSLMGFGFNILTAMLTPLVVVLAISDDVHLIQHFDHERLRGSSEHAFKATVSYLFVPLLGASGTTALGLLSLATSDVVAIRHFGIGAAAGVMVDFVSSIILVPTLLMYLPARSKVRPQKQLTGSLERVADYATRWPALVLAGAIVVAGFALVGITRLRVDTNHIGFFSRSHPLSQSASVIDGSLAGVYSFHVLLEGPPDSMKAPETVKRIDQLAAAISSLPRIRKATSVADYVKRANQAVRDGNPADAVIPTDPFLVGQELFLLSLNDEGRRELERVVSSDFSTAQIIVRLPSMSSGRVFELIQESQRLGTQAFAGTDVRATATGSGRLFSALDHYVVRSQIASFATAFTTILAATFLIFRSVRYGLLALVPNVLPVVAVLGFMGWSGITINIATVMVASVALGVVDDDTVHFLHRLRHEIADGKSVVSAARIAAIFEGRAALTTAFINSCGFAVLVLSEYKPSAWFGGLLALTLSVAFLAEILVLPATVSVVSRYLSRRPAHSVVS